MWGCAEHKRATPTGDAPIGTHARSIRHARGRLLADQAGEATLVARLPGSIPACGTPAHAPFSLGASRCRLAPWLSARLR
ncbi:MAG TPA: hypothetical protein VFT66_16740 [Roseiflexaceae bacterium]|nr:hypothetical protein [Roseiflexaceae bacterium]